MNTKKKALVSGVAGAALLLGTGATFALWQAETPLTGAASISIGTMSVVADIDWDDSIQHWVPTDVARGTITIDKTLVGDNLVVEVTNNGGLDDTIAELTAELFDVEIDFSAVQNADGSFVEFTPDSNPTVEIPIAVTFVNRGQTYWGTNNSVYGTSLNEDGRRVGEQFSWNWSDLSIIITQVID